MKKSSIDAFLNDLTELSKKHGIWIGGCGCCASPYLFDDPKDGTEDSYVTGGEFLEYDECLRRKGSE